MLVPEVGGFVGPIDHPALFHTAGSNKILPPDGLKSWCGNADIHHINFVD